MDDIHVMFDLETLACQPDAVVLSIGAVKFNRHGVIGSGLEWYLDIGHQMAHGRVVDPGTQKWWEAREPEARKVFDLCAARGQKMTPVLEELQGWIPPKALVWGNGAIFDIGILEDLFRARNVKVPWKFSNVRCYRTIKALYHVEMGKARQGVHHNALDDAMYQAECLVPYLQKLKGM
jgi:hypothetical protein